MDGERADWNASDHGSRPPRDSGGDTLEDRADAAGLPEPSSGSSRSSPRDPPPPPLRPASESDQQTIISKSPPDAVPHFSRAGIQDLGRILVGEQLGHFVLEEFVGGGGMGAVFRATDIELGRSVALKVVSGVHNDDDTLRRFKNEAQSAARLDHHNIARVYYVGEDKGWHYIVFEFISGVNIRDLVEHRGPLPLDEAIYYTLQVSEALAHASQRDVVHRDIKPSNVLVMQDGKVKLVDMGLARLHQVESAADDLTASGVTLGTFDYISPEQARDPRSADVRSDLYSLGCTLYYMLTGRPPFPEGTVLQKLFSHSLDAPPDPRDVRPELPEEVTQIVHRLLAKNPQDRFQTPGELIKRLLRLADDLQLSLIARPTLTDAESPVPAWTRFESHLPWMIPAALLALVVLVLEFATPPRGYTVRPPELPSAVVRAVSEPVAVAEPDEASSSQPSDMARDTRRSEDDGASLPETVSPVESEPEASLADVPGAPPQVQAPLALRVGPDTVSGSLGPDFGEFLIQPLRSDGRPSADPPWRTGEYEAPRPDESGPAAPVYQPPVAPRRIMVGQAPESLPADALTASSLASALQRAAEQPTVDTIELWFHEELVEQPLQITVKTPLRFQAAPGYRPVVRYRPQVGGFGTTRRMIELSGGVTDWQDIHFRLELPTEPTEGWALFGLRGIDRLDLRNCTFTIQNLDEYGLEWQNGAAMFQFDAPQVPTRMDMGMDGDMDDPGMNPMPAPREPPELNLFQCAVRGQASLIRADLALPMTVTWRQGLLACNERLFVFGGAVDATAWDAEVKIELEKVTAVVDKGLGLMTLDGRGPVLIDLVLDLKDCIVAMNYDAPLLEHRGTSSVDRVERSLVFRGDRNFYPLRTPPPTSLLGPRSLSRIRWRVITAGGTRREFLFDEKDRDWYQEKGAKEVVTWARPLPPGLPFHLHLLDDYEVVPRPGSQPPSAGFDRLAIPDFPDAAEFSPLVPLTEELFMVPDESIP
jgi:eukaryotic-like serine/threonine-protein kinase